jgi:hypothetical protein
MPSGSFTVENETILFSGVKKRELFGGIDPQNFIEPLNNW